MTCGFTFLMVGTDFRLPDEQLAIYPGRPGPVSRWWLQISFPIFTPKSWENAPIWGLHIFQMGSFKHQAIFLFGGAFFSWIGAHLFELTQRWFICSLCWAYKQRYLHCVLFDGNPMLRLFLHKEKKCSPILQGSTQNLRLSMNMCQSVENDHRPATFFGRERGLPLLPVASCSNHWIAMTVLVMVIKRRYW